MRIADVGRTGFRIRTNEPFGAGTRSDGVHAAETIGRPAIRSLRERAFAHRAARRGQRPHPRLIVDAAP
ncbi:hypothetical protein SUDANB6_01124 [Streptomyces sp. enrichment culture]|uniref:hypothetical protein n=1 Tax=Streptomyces sp. enrichment culture TaxID=1795815 RepID=UPI003F54772F